MVPHSSPIPGAHGAKVGFVTADENDPSSTTDALAAVGAMSVIPTRTPRTVSRRQQLRMAPPQGARRIGRSYGWALLGQSVGAVESGAIGVVVLASVGSTLSARQSSGGPRAASAVVDEPPTTDELNHRSV